MKLYRLNVTADGKPSAIFALAEDVDSLLHTLEYEDHGEADEESLLPYFDGEKKPRVIRSLEEVQRITWTSSAWATIRKDTP
jgi:hypothetical protein